MKLTINFAQSKTDFIIKKLDPNSNLSSKLRTLVDKFINTGVDLYTLNSASDKGAVINNAKGLLGTFIEKGRNKLSGQRGLIVVTKDDVIFYDTSKITDKSDKKPEDTIHYVYSVHSMKDGSNSQGLVYDSKGGNVSWDSKSLDLNDPNFTLNDYLVYAYKWHDEDNKRGIYLSYMTPIEVTLKFKHNPTENEFFKYLDKNLSDQGKYLSGLGDLIHFEILEGKDHNDTIRILSHLESSLNREYTEDVDSRSNNDLLFIND